jgi:hypothetical protein
MATVGGTSQGSQVRLTRGRNLHQDGSTFDGQWLRERVAQLNTIFISGGEAPLHDG